MYTKLLKDYLLRNTIIFFDKTSDKENFLKLEREKIHSIKTLKRASIILPVRFEKESFPDDDGEVKDYLYCVETCVSPEGKEITIDGPNIYYLSYEGLKTQILEDYCSVILNKKYILFEGIKQDVTEVTLDQGVLNKMHFKLPK